MSLLIRKLEESNNHFHILPGKLDGECMDRDHSLFASEKKKKKEGLLAFTKPILS